MTAGTNVAVIERQPRSVLVDMSSRFGMEPAAFEATLRATVCKGNVSREEFAAFLLVAKEYHLNPLTKEIYAFPAKGGGIQPIVSIDGWCRIINEQPVLDGIEFSDVLDGGALIAVTCRIYRKDRTRPTEVTEYMAECKRSTDVWKTWPARMLRHKALIQAARYAFGFSGIVEQDEYERTVQGPATTTRPDVRERLEARGEGEREGFTAAHSERHFAEHAAEIADVLDATLDGDRIPDFNPETGEITEGIIDPPADDGLPIRDDTDDDFPGDRIAAARAEAEPNKAASEASPLSIAQRVDAFKKRVDAAPGVAKLKSLWVASAPFRSDLDAADPKEGARLEQYWNAALAAAEDRERRGE